MKKTKEVIKVMRPAIISMAFMVTLMFPTIVNDQMFLYDILKQQYPALTVEMWNALTESVLQQRIPSTFANIPSGMNNTQQILMMCAIMQRESSFQNVIGFTGSDIGVCQINRAHTGTEFLKYFDIPLNIKKGFAIYRSALRRSKGDPRQALAYYNAGENYDLAQYKKWCDYVDVIMASYQRSCILLAQRPTIK